MELAGGGLAFTSRLSVRSQPWLADHVLRGRVILAGTAFTELAVSAGDQAGCGQVEELALHAPLVLPPDGAVQVQVRGRRTRHGRAPGGGGARPPRRWQRGLGGARQRHPVPGEPAGTGGADLAGRRADLAGTGGGELAEWPPPGAVPVPVADLYERHGRGGLPVRAGVPRAAGGVAARG